MAQIGMYSGDPATILANYDPSGAWLARKPIGTYHFAATATNVASTTAVIAGAPDNINCYPFFVPRRWRVDRFNFYAGNAVIGAKVRTGIYDSDPVTSLPRNLVYDNGETDVSGGAAQYETVMDLTMMPGMYWTAKIQNNNKTFRTMAPGYQSGILGTVDGATFNQYNVYSTAQAYGALPNPHPGGGNMLYSSNGCFVIMLRTLEG